MKGLGGALFFFGIGSIILYFLKMEFILLMWIETWGETTAWAIRIGLVVVGGILYVAGFTAEKKTSGGG